MVDRLGFRLVGCSCLLMFLKLNLLDFSCFVRIDDLAFLRLMRPQCRNIATTIVKLTSTFAGAEQVRRQTSCR